MLIAGLFLAVLGKTSAVGAPTWTPTSWNGEHAYTLETASWKAVVSVERERLISFGPAGSDTNLLNAPVTKTESQEWGGHRVWCGPQTTWRGFWPPPAQWEKSAAESVRADGPSLEIVVPDAGDGWPHMVRVYEIDGGRLACRVRISGGTRPSQIVQILQVPSSALVEARPAPTKEWPMGFVQLLSTAGPGMVPKFEFTPHLARKGDMIELHFVDAVEKFGFPPQPLVAHILGTTLRVERGPARGSAIEAPDAGFYSQIYLGSGKTSGVIELEQLSPRWKAGEPAEFSMLVDLAAP